MPQVMAAIGEERQKVLYECLECRRPELKSALIATIVKKSGHAFLQDCDWRVNYVLSSSKVSDIGQPVALFTFALCTQQTFSLELSLSDMDRLIHVLREAQTSITD